MKRIIVSFVIGVFVGIHRNVIKSLITGSPMPKAPEWHCWVKQENSVEED